MDTNKIIAKSYQIVKALFQINSFLYVQRNSFLIKSAHWRITRS